MSIPKRQQSSNDALIFWQTFGTHPESRLDAQQLAQAKLQCLAAWQPNGDGKPVKKLLANQLIDQTWSVEAFRFAGKNSLVTGTLNFGKLKCLPATSA
jgi:hypothetical protein